jgi:hypothetical protein
MLRRSISAVVGAALSLGAAACGGSGGAGGTPEGFLTADARGLASGGESGAAAPGAAASDAAGEISRAIEEADVYHVEGDILYLANSWRGLVVADLAGPTLLGTLPTTGFPHEMHVRGSHAFLLLADFDGGTTVLDVSVADPSAPALLGSFPLGGWYRTSRLVGDVLYVLTDGAAHSFDATGALAPVDSLAVPGGAQFAHATDAFLFVAAPDLGGGTLVTLVDVGDPGGALALRGSLPLPGYVSDEWKLHFGAGTLRVVTHDGADGALSRLFVADVADPDAPYVRGTLELARGEQLFATRFTDEAAFLVTFEQVDPLWVVDLTDPDAPAVTGSLVVPGWSTHLVALDGRLVALGIDPADWHAVASLFDVSDPANPTLASRVDFGWGWSNAFHDVKGFGVFEAEGLVLVPFSGEGQELAVLDLGPASLSYRGAIACEGTVLRGFPHPEGLVAITTEEVVVAHAATLAVTGRVTVAEDVADAMRLPDGTLVQAIRRSAGCRVGGVDLPLAFSRAFPHGMRVAVTGWDDDGTAAYVVDFSVVPPAVSPRLEVGGGGWWGGPIPLDAKAGWGAAAPDGVVYGGWFGGEGVLTPDGRLALRSLPSGLEDVTIGTGDALDGFVVIDVPGGAVETTIAVRGAYASGFVADGESLVLTVGTYAGDDGVGRPLMLHDLVRVDLVAAVASPPVNVPGFVVRSDAPRVFTVEEVWGADWTFESSVVASDLSTGTAAVLDRLPLPDGAYDYRAAGATLWFTTYGAFAYAEPALGGALGGGGGHGVPFAPTAEIRTVRLGESLAFGPSIAYDADFASLLLPEEDGALVVRNGLSVDRWDVSGPTATLDASADVGTWPPSARPDAAPGTYLLALGYGGVATFP